MLNSFVPAVRARALVELSRILPPAAAEEGRVWPTCTATPSSPSTPMATRPRRWPGWPGSTGLRLWASSISTCWMRVDEFLAACELAGVRGSAGHRDARLRARVRHARRSTRPASRASPTTWASAFTTGARAGRGRRHPGRTCARAPRSATGSMVARVNAYLAPVAVDYDARRAAPDAGRQRHRAAHAGGLHAARPQRAVARPGRASGPSKLGMDRGAGRQAMMHDCAGAPEPGARQTDEAGRRRLRAARTRHRSRPWTSSTR